MQNLHDPRNRTHEFFQTVHSLQKARVLNGNNSNNTSTSLSSSSSTSSLSSKNSLPPSLFNPGPAAGSTTLYASTSNSASSPLLTPEPPHQPQTQFTLAAKSIGSSIYEVTQKLEHLGKLAKQRSLYNDPVVEINHLTIEIKNDLQHIDKDLNMLYDYVQSNQHSKRNENVADVSNRHNDTHNRAIIDNLKGRLAQTTKSFQEVLQTRTKNIKEQNSRRKQFESNNSVLLRKRQVNAFDSLLQDSTSSSSNATVDLEPPTQDDIEPGVSAQQQSTQQMQLYNDTTDSYLLSRAQAVESIESTIHELGDMYKRLVSIVGMQEEITLRIDANMDATLINVESGHNELLKYFDRMSSNRWLILKIFAILIAFLVFFMVFIA